MLRNGNSLRSYNDFAGRTVMKCVKPIELRTKLRISTWQEVALAAPPALRGFLSVKYGLWVNEWSREQAQ
jgi:hypothetical protein